MTLLGFSSGLCPGGSSCDDVSIYLDLEHGVLMALDIIICSGFCVRGILGGTNKVKVILDSAFYIMYTDRLPSPL